MSAEKYQNKYRIASARMKNYDYASNGAYFITIVTQNRDHFFGDIVDNKMILNEIGKIAQKYWDEIPQHFPFIRLDEMVVMPNNIHGILFCLFSIYIFIIK
jgi:REP element-mobilizing transposase RayT